MSTTNHKSKVTIGMPVFNGEKFLKSSIDSLLSQTYQNFELIISDNNSTDLTESICREYKKQDSRIKYYRQKENIGQLENFKFVLNVADTEYFVWLAADDWWEPTFLEKNISILDLEKRYIASVSKIDYYDIEENTSLSKKNIILSKIKFYSYDQYPKFGSYSNRVSFYLRLNRAENIYAVFRTSILKECVDECWIKPSVAMDSKILLLIQKYGEIYILDETLMHRSAKGISSPYSGKNLLIEANNSWILGIMFPYLSYSIWILRKLGVKIFFKNLDFILLINASGAKYQIRRFFKHVKLFMKNFRS